jgi:hypothetical protein
MLFWYRTLQEVVSYLPTAVRIVQEQNPNALTWASRRFEEFGRLLAKTMVPNQNRNGVDWSQRNYKDTNDLLFFDNYYGRTSRVWLRISLQFLAAPNPQSFIQATLQIEDETRDRVRCSGEIVLEGQCGKAWHVHSSIRVRDAQYDELLRAHFGAFLSEWPSVNEQLAWSARIRPADARTLVLRMAEFAMRKTARR